MTDRGDRNYVMNKILGLIDVHINDMSPEYLHEINQVVAQICEYFEERY